MKAWNVIDGATLTAKSQSTRSNIPYLKKARSALGRPSVVCLSEIVDSVQDENSSSVLQLHNIRRATSRICKISRTRKSHFIDWLTVAILDPAPAPSWRSSLDVFSPWI